MRIHYTPTFADYWSLNLHVLRKQFRYILWIAGALLLLYLLLPITMHYQGDQRDALAIYQDGLGTLVLPGIVGLSFIGTFWSAKKRWTAAQELREEKNYDIDDSGIRMTTKSMESFADWSLFKDWTVTKKFVYLRTAQRQFHYFPISAVPDIDHLLQLIGSKVKNSKTAKAA